MEKISSFMNKVGMFLLNMLSDEQKVDEIVVKTLGLVRHSYPGQFG